MDYPHRIRDSIHNFIHFSDTEKTVIGWPEFQRLRHIRQLALTNYVYPGAMHTRFEHSLGVMELSTRIFNRLYLKERKKIDKNFKAIGISSPKALEVLRLAALFHDSGHLPFSHGAEAILPKGKKHEDISVAVLGMLAEKIDGLYFKNAAGIAAQLIHGSVIPELNFLRNILSGPVDSDRMDYLLRDSHYCGVKYGNFDSQRLIETLKVIDREGGGLELAVDHGGIHIIESLILARYFMFTQVYYHRLRRIYDIYLKEFMLLWNLPREPLTELIKFDDISLMNELRNVANDADNPAYDWANRICTRKYHRLVYETSEFADARMVKKARGILKELQNKYPKTDFIIDDNARGVIHKFYRQGDDQEGEEFYVIHKYRECLITDESAVLRMIKPKFQVIRIYADEASDKNLKLIRNKSRKLDKEME